MFSYFKAHGKAVLSMGLVALVAAAIFSPACAYADEVTRTMDWSMTITLQSASGQALTSAKAPATGDSSLLVIIGALAIIAGAAYLFCASRKLARSAAGPAALQDPASSRKKMALVAIAAAMIAGLCIGLFAYSTAVAHADERQAEVQGTSTVTVNEQGKVLNSSIAISNNYASAIKIIGVQAPDRLKDWTVNLSQTSVKSGGKVAGSWNAKAIPSDVLTELKNKGGKLTLKMTGLISYQTGTVAYTVNHYAENLDGTYPAEPTTTETMYGLGGDSTQAKALDMEGFTAQEFSQTTVKPDGTAVVSIQYSRNSYQVEFDGNGHSIDTPEQTVKFGAPVAKPANPVAGGLTFDGWFTDAACTAPYDFENATMPASDVKLYAKWSLTPIDFDKAKVDTGDKTYSAQELKPAASIEGLIEGTDYTVAYSNNVKAGTASIKLTGIGDYKGEETYDFSILPAEVKVSGIKAINKDHDGTTFAQLDCSNAVIAGLLGTDKVAVTATGSFKNPDVGENKKVLISDIVLEGDAATNYKLAATGQQTEATATIVGNYRIFYKNVGDGINLNPEGYSSTDESFDLVDAVWEGYDFDGWYDQDGTTAGNWGNRVTTIVHGTNSDITLYAKWLKR